MSNKKEVNEGSWLPDKQTVYSFVFNFLLLTVTLIAGHFYIPQFLEDTEAHRIQAQNLLEKKNAFVAEFSKQGQSRIYLAENFYRITQDDSLSSARTNAWERYFESVVKWNEQNLFNPLFIEEYFGRQMRDRFEQELNPKLSSLHDMLYDLKFGRHRPDAEGVIETAKNEMYRFAEDMIGIREI
jgi:flagellar biosynthesis/type III secretory pathway chaperone